MNIDPAHHRFVEIRAILALLAAFVATVPPVLSARADDRLELPPGDPVALVLDDGTAEANWEPLLLEHYLFNRFSPSEFPLLLEEISVFVPEIVQVPMTLRVAVFQDIDANPQNGAQLVATAQMSIDQVEVFASIPLDPPVQLSGPGDVWIGLGESGFPITGIDLGFPEGRSFYCVSDDGPWHQPCSPGAVGGNLMIRSFGTVTVPVALQSFSVE